MQYQNFNQKKEVKSINDIYFIKYLNGSGIKEEQAKFPNYTIVSQEYYNDFTKDTSRKYGLISYQDLYISMLGSDGKQQNNINIYEVVPASQLITLMLDSEYLKLKIQINEFYFY